MAPVGLDAGRLFASVEQDHDLIEDPGVDLGRLSAPSTVPRDRFIDTGVMLIERPIDFAHGYRMRCEHCSASNWLTAKDYAARPEAIMTCSGCKEDFNFGPAVIDLRSPTDAALDDSQLPQLAWYHTTKDSEWPQIKKPPQDDLVNHLRDRARWSEEKIDAHRQIDENQALHLGTYEAAIESMLRRMNEQNDQTSVFYLNRVRLRPDLVVESGFRDENHTEAAKITSFDLEQRGVNGIRYLNAYESIGSISLATGRKAIDSIQRTVVPVPELVVSPDSAIVERMRNFRKKVHAIRAAQTDKRPSPLDKILLRASAQPGGPPPPEPIEAYKTVSAMQSFMADQYLDSVSPVVREDFLRSIHPPRPADTDEADLAWLSKFMGLSALLTRPDEVQRVLTSKPWQAIQP